MEIIESEIIGVYEIDLSQSVSYLIKSILECLQRWRKIKIIVVKNEK